ncbi:MULTISPECIES: cobalt ABC transporter permease [Clostridium]|uniref:cobalt ABC transporter permease n=1 Tax=Clostridium TaxID=1485 RepID=UPI00041E9F15|nr:MULTISPECIES: cobalt ABC transporter permease [Clostridium]MBN7573661.1 cobalt ABC transporter permease [Clostridium beijerinckii]MBN7578925.1 cobalt ABC transporter permease [Clostridium beijerinckii]MBN7583292.1 cobalt ABC transporter permease [Clostridium beijerinckii]MBO0521230.1 cobalt ABC transporter permease [Clostridium beijerinckii]MZK52618.1 cobalt ABC transporter permease [Clostridium beijerinckii]
MKEILINQILPIVDTSVVAILAVIIKQVGNSIIDFFIQKKSEISQKIKINEHQEEINTAKEVWNIVEEKFRITENATGLLTSKADEFDKVLMERIPGVSKENLEFLRQTIAGEVNKGRDMLTKDSKAQ